MLAILCMTTINSCKKDIEKEPVPNKGVTAEKTNVKTYEIINLIAHGNLANKYSATFGSVAIEILKTSDSTLTFYVPDIVEGEASLKFDLATIKFNVTKTVEVNANQLVINLTQNFDTQVSSLNPSTPNEAAEVDSLIHFKQEVVSLFNSLSEDEKRQAALFYEANKEVFKLFSSNTYSNLDAPTTFVKQSQCPKTDFNSFYGCTAENLGGAAIDLKNASKEFLTMLGLAGASAYLAPASFGLSAFGTTLALGTAGYLLITEVRPAVAHFKHSLFPFLGANWIFALGVYQATTEVFQDQISTSLNLDSKFRSLNSNDGNVNSGSGYFIRAMSSLSEYWNKLTSIFGNFPSYNNTEAATTLATNEISISNISNSNVQYLGNTGQSVKFKSVSGNEENFSYNLKVTKEGFVEEKTLTGKVLAVTDSTAIYKAACVGWWTVNHYDPINPMTTYTLELFANGSGTYHIPGNPTTYNTSWSIQKSGNEYRFFESGFWHPSYDALTRDKLTYPLTMFKVYGNFDPNFVVQEYIKN